MDFTFTSEQKAIQDVARTLAQERFAPKAFTWDGFPWENAKTLAQAGFTGITIPVSDGGQGGTLMDAVIVMEAVSQICPNSGDVVQATNFGAIRQVSAFGSERVKQDVLPALLAGDGLISAGMSESEAGSALTDLRTTARYDGDDVVLDGEKIWSSYAPEITALRDLGAVRAAKPRHRLRRRTCRRPGFLEGPAGDVHVGRAPWRALPGRVPSASRVRPCRLRRVAQDVHHLRGGTGRQRHPGTVRWPRPPLTEPSSMPRTAPSSDAPCASSRASSGASPT